MTAKDETWGEYLQRVGPRKAYEKPEEYVARVERNELMRPDEDLDSYGRRVQQAMEQDARGKQLLRHCTMIVKGLRQSIEERKRQTQKRRRPGD